jgi:hypothetical protein
MKLRTITLAGALALSSTLAFAQGGGNAAAGAALPESSGAATNTQGGAIGNTTGGNTRLNQGTTTGMNGAKPDASKPGGESTARKGNGG